MKRFVDVLVEDCSDLIKYALLLTLLGGGAVSCVALSSYIAHATVMRPSEAAASFNAIMSFSQSGLTEPVRRTVEICNWIGLLGIGLVTIRTIASYFTSVGHRAIRPNNVVQFPHPVNSGPSLGSNVANL